MIKKIKFSLKSRQSLLIAMMVMFLGTSIVSAAFYRINGSTNQFEYGYGYGYEYGYGYGYGWHKSDGQNNDEGFFGNDGRATGVSATSGSNLFTVSYTTNYLAQNRINYGLTNTFGNNSSQTVAQTGTNSITVSGLSCGTTYHYRVETTDAGGNIWYSTNTSHTITTSACASSGGGGGSSVRISEDNKTSSLSDAQFKALIEILRVLFFGEKLSLDTSIFTRDLTLNSVGNDVMQLQKYLNANGFLLATSGPGSLGNETNFFGPLTRDALARFQVANGIVPSVGYFGPITRAFISSR
ncbi:MAG TPA: peptidoglycan-binding domain-containing protein [Candidatus Paceibacterota bacterium]|nr:peptidoglycan-binding domain-containing protein [Candidatus Paceibacterota bacterium]